MMKEKTEFLSSQKSSTKITLLLASSLTVMAGAIIAPSLPSITKEFAEVNNASLLVKLLLTMPALIIAFSAPFSGFLADKAGRKPLLVFGLIVYAIAGTTGLYLSDLYLLIAGRALLGIAVAAIMIASVSLAGDYFTGKARNQFLGFQASFMAAGGIVYLVSGGLLADIHWRWPFAMYAFSLVILLMAFFFIHEPVYLQNIPKQHKRVRLPFKILGISTIIFTGMLMFYFIPVQLPFLLTSVLNTGNAEVGYAIGISTFASAISSLGFKRIKDFANFSSLMAMAFALMAIGFYFISQSELYVTMLPSIFISGLGLGLFIPTSNLWIMHAAPIELRGTALGIMNAFLFLGQFFSPIVASPVIDTFNLQITFSVAAGFLLLLSFLVMILPKIKHFVYL